MTVFGLSTVILGSIYHVIGYLHILFRLNDIYHENASFNNAIRCKCCIYFLGTLIFLLPFLILMLILSKYPTDDDCNLWAMSAEFCLFIEVMIFLTSIQWSFVWNHDVYSKKCKCRHEIVNRCMEQRYRGQLDNTDLNEPLVEFTSNTL